MHNGWCTIIWGDLRGGLVRGPGAPAKGWLRGQPDCTIISRVAKEAYSIPHGSPKRRVIPRDPRTDPTVNSHTMNPQWHCNAIKMQMAEYQTKLVWVNYPGLHDCTWLHFLVHVLFSNAEFFVSIFACFLFVCFSSFACLLFCLLAHFWSSPPPPLGALPHISSSACGGRASDHISPLAGLLH